MNEIKVMIAGMVLLVSTNAYLKNGSDMISSAIAIEAGKPHDSKYDVDIPLHEPVLRIDPASVNVVIADPEKRLVTDGNNDKILRLRGDRVQLVKGGAKCKPVSGAMLHAMTRDSTISLPRLGEIVGPDVALAPGTYPAGSNNDDFTGMDSSRVAAWLDIQGGRLRALRSADPTEDEVEFRPSRRRATLSPEVEWTLAADEVDCMIVTPFSGKNAIVISLKPDAQHDVRFQVKAIADSGEGIEGIGYDYELFYKLIADPPEVPPIPYAIVRKAKAEQNSSEHVHGSTGVNCGPPKIR